MRIRLLCSLLLIVTAASLSSGAIWQPPAQEPALQPISVEDAALIAMMVFDDDPECPDLTDPFAPPNRHFCELGCWIEYLLGMKTCSEYVDCWLDCQGIPN